MIESQNKENYIRHLIECQCILKIYEKRTKPIFHKFAVFSIFDEENNIIEKYVQCNNCNALHKVYDFQKSEIMWGKDGYIGLVNNINDIRNNLISQGYQKLTETLDSYKIIDISLWEKIEYLLDTNSEDHIILEKKEIDNNVIIKFLYIKEKGFKIKTESFQGLI